MELNLMSLQNGNFLRESLWGNLEKYFWELLKAL